MSTEPVIHRKQRRVVIVANELPAVPALAVAEAKAPRPLLKLRARSSTPAAAPPLAEPEAAAGVLPASAQQERLSPAERERRQAAKAQTALQVLAAHFPSLFTNVRPLAIGTGKVLDAERKAGRLPLGCIPLKLALSAWTASEAYLEAVAAGGVRFNLAGEVEGEVTPKQLAYATRKLQRRRDAAARPHEAPGDAAISVAPHAG